MKLKGVGAIVSFKQIHVALRSTYDVGSNKVGNASRLQLKVYQLAHGG